VALDEANSMVPLCACGFCGAEYCNELAEADDPPPSNSEFRVLAELKEEHDSEMNA
jgi:hypothetical protein